MAVDTQTLHGVDDLLAKLKSLPPEIVSKRGGPVKSGLRKGAVVIQRAAQAKIRAIVQGPDKDGYVSTDTLAKSVAVRRDKNPGRAGANERYRVIISRSKQFTYRDNLTKAIMTARWLEYGNEKRPPTPWLTPAFFEARQDALDTTVKEIERGVERIVKKLSL